MHLKRHTNFGDHENAIRILRVIRRAPGTLPFASLRTRGAEASAPTQARSTRLFLQVDMLDILDGQAQESLSQAAELFGGVSGEELQAGSGTTLFG